MKTCSKCKVAKDIEYFTLRSDTGKHRTQCKLCITLDKKAKRQHVSLQKRISEGKHTPSNDRKYCNHCCTIKLLCEFPLQASNKTDGRRGRCRQCESLLRKLPLNQLNDRKRQRDWYGNMPDSKKSEYIKKKSDQNIERFKTNPEALRKKRLYVKTDRAIYIRYRYDASRRSRNYVFELSFTVFSSLINSNCFYCGAENCRGVDRFNNDLGYTISNSVSCCKLCNEVKMQYSVKQMYNHLNKMAKHFKLNKETIKLKARICRFHSQKG